MDYDYQYDKLEQKYEHEHETHHGGGKKACCPVKVYEDVSVSVPVKIQAHADVGNIEIHCRGHEIIRDIGKSHHRHHDSSNFTIKQKIQVVIPVKFLTECNIGKSHVGFDSLDPCDD